MTEQRPNDKDLKGLVVQATGLSDGSSTLKAVLGSFKALRQFAAFDESAENEEAEVQVSSEPSSIAVSTTPIETAVGSIKLGYTINLNLPATSDVAVFDAIFHKPAPAPYPVGKAMLEDALGDIKKFMMTSLLIEHALDQLEQSSAIDLGRRQVTISESDKVYYPQIDQAFRVEASRMAPHYEAFYSLEKAIRGFIVDTLQSIDESDWWDSKVPEKIRNEAESRQQRELDTGMTPRSDDPLDFTTFGELGEIIKANWDVFGGALYSRKAVERVMANLNSLRGPIAHCSPLAEDEVVRLRLSFRDWFRLME